MPDHRPDHHSDPQRTDVLLSEFFHLSEFIPPESDLPFDPRLIHPVLLYVLDSVRGSLARPVKINSGARSLAHQRRLIAGGLRAATVSPHVPVYHIEPDDDVMVIRPCLAVDIDTSSRGESIEVRNIVRARLPEARVFWKQYAPASFVHVDVAPLLRFSRLEWIGQGERDLPDAWCQPGLGD